MGLSNVMLMSLRSVGTVRISLVVYLSSLFINTGCNWLLIFGNLGFPRLEMRGAAIATVLARLVELSIAAFYIFRLEKKISLRPQDVVAFDRTFIRDFAVNVSPVILNEFLWSMGNSALMMIMGRMAVPLSPPAASPTSPASSLRSLLSALATPLRSLSAIRWEQAITTGPSRWPRGSPYSVYCWAWARA